VIRCALKSQGTSVQVSCRWLRINAGTCKTRFVAGSSPSDVSTHCHRPQKLGSSKMNEILHVERFLRMNAHRIFGGALFIEMEVKAFAGVFVDIVFCCEARTSYGEHRSTRRPRGFGSNLFPRLLELEHWRTSDLGGRITHYRVRYVGLKILALTYPAQRYRCLGRRTWDGTTEM